VISPTFTAANSVINYIRAMPNQFTGGKGPMTGEEEKFDIIFNTPFVLGPSASVLKIEG